MSNDGSSAVQERRQLLEYVLEVHKARGGKVDLPIGMTTAEPWMLDSLDVVALLSHLSSSPKGKLDLISYCRQGSATRAALHKHPSGRRTTGPSEGGLGEGEVVEPQLDLPQLSTGLSEAELKDLAYLVFASNTRGASAATPDLMSTVRSQLDIDEGRGEEVGRLLGAVEGRVGAPGQLPGAGQLSAGEGWAATLELPVLLLRVVRPRDFRRFRSFVTWRDTLAHVLSATLWQTVRDGWGGGGGSSGGEEGPRAQQLLARLKAGLRRCDVRCADDYDEEEYSAAVAGVADCACAVVGRCGGAGWHFPWGMRVRLAEVLLRGVFDTVEEASYIPDVTSYLKLLETRVWPLLGISPNVHNTGFAWVHFRQYVLTQDTALLKSTKALLQKLAQVSAPPRSPSHRSLLGGPSSNGTSSHHYPAAPSSPPAADDATLTQEVGKCVIGWVRERLEDYHAKLAGPLGGAAAMPGLVEVFSCAALSAGASLGEVQEQLVAALHSSVDAGGRVELSRRLAAEGPYPCDADELRELAGLVRGLAAEEGATWAAALGSALPEAAGLAAARLYGCFGRRYLPFMAQLSTLDDDHLGVIHAALALEPVLLGPIREALLRATSPLARELLGAARPWDTQLLLQPVLAAWVEQQTRGFSVWVRRQLEEEKWRPVGGKQGYSTSAQEVRRMITESLDVLFAMELPVPSEILSMHMEGIEAVLDRYWRHIRDQLGRWERLVPPPPPLTRYKREVAVAQEAAEEGLPGLPGGLPPPGARTKKGEFMETVARVEMEPHFPVIQEWTAEKLVVMLCSLGYLLDALGPIAASVQERWHCAHSRLSTPQGSGTFGPASSGVTGLGYHHSRNSTQDEGYGLGGSGRHARTGSGGMGPKAGGGWYPQAPPSSSGSGNHSGRFGEGDRRLTGNWGQAWGGGWQPGAAPGGARVQELFGTMLEAADQALRGGITYVSKWLVAKVVWWDLRPQWCELLYRHRCTTARLEELLRRDLDDALATMTELLPREGRAALAHALLKECCLALERVLLDGGPLRQFVPADVEALKDDMHALKELFVADGEGLALEDVEEAMAGLRSLLRVMALETGDLTHYHTGAIKAAVYSPSPRSVGSASPYASPRNEYQVHSSGASKAATWKAKGKALLGPLQAGLSSDPAAGGGGGGEEGFGTYSVQGTGVSSVSMRGMAAAGGYSLGRRSAEELLLDEQVLLRVLCHRADHPASKYLKDSCKVRKPREETVQEVAKRILNFNL